MTTDHHLKLLNSAPRIRWNALAGALGMGAIAYTTYVLAHRLYPVGDNAIAVAMLVFAIGFMVGIVFYLKALLIPSLVSVDAAELRVRDLRRNQLMHSLTYADVAAYRHQVFNGTEELRLTLHSGQCVYLKSAANLDTANKFAGMVRAFEHQLARATAAPTLAGASTSAPVALPVREKGFLEKPLAAGLLFAATLAVGLLGWQVAAGHLTVGQVAGAVAMYLSYLIAWLAARRRS